jgi:hypothetical protein
MRDGAKCPYVRLLDLTRDWEFGTHTILLRKERKKGMVGRGRPAKSA